MIQIAIGLVILGVTPFLSDGAGQVAALFFAALMLWAGIHESRGKTRDRD